MSSKDLAEDEQLNARGFFAAPTASRSRHANTYWDSVDSDQRSQWRAVSAPLLGQHTDEVLRDVLGYTDEDIARLRAQQVLY